MNDVPLPGRALDRHAAAEPADRVADDVQPDPAARQLADLVAGREPGLEDQVVDPRVVGRGARPGSSPCDPLADDPLPVEARGRRR